MLSPTQQEKIANFNLMVENRDEAIAKEFLQMSNWDEEKAVKLYLENINALKNNQFQNHPQHINQPNDFNNYNNNNNNRNRNYKECQLPLNDGMVSKVFSFVKSGLGFTTDNSEYCKYFLVSTIGLVKDKDRFMKLLRTKKGVIILFNAQISNTIKQHLIQINKNSFDKIKNTIFYPIINTSIEGESLIQQLSIKSFPCILFCEYKNQTTFYVTNKIEGMFSVNNFMNILNPQESSNSNHNRNNNNNNNIHNNAYNNMSNLNQNNNYVNFAHDDYYNQSDYDNDIIKMYANEFNNYGNSNSNYNPPAPINSSQIPQQFPNNNNNYDKKDINPVPNNILNNNNNNNNNQKKEYIPDYRDYDLSGSLNLADLDKSNKDINNYGYNYHNYENNNYNYYMNNGYNQNYINNYNYNYNVNNIGYNQNNNNNNKGKQNIPLSESTIIRKEQDDEMKQLERIEEEKERQKKEEEEKIKKEEEKQKEIIKTEEEEKQIFSQLIPPEPADDNPDKCIICFRLPDGEKNIQRKFLKTNKISVLYDYIKSLGREIYSEDQYHTFSLIQTFPFKNFEDKLNNTLEEEGLFPNSVLQIKENN